MRCCLSITLQGGDMCQTVEQIDTHISDALLGLTCLKGVRSSVITRLIVLAFLGDNIEGCEHMSNG